MLINKVAVGPYNENCYILVCPLTRESIIVDPGADAEVIQRAADGTKAQLIVITHSHRDHVGALAQISQATDAPIAAHPLEVDKLPVPSSRLLDEGDTVSFGTVKLRVIHTPGHTPGSICLLGDGVLIAGDTIFPNGPGHTVSPEALAEIVRTIEEKIMPLPDETVVHPGHGESTTIGAERPRFQAFASKPIPAGLCGDVTWTS
ncbi:MAG: MBL fold metallo-hydrolase [Chloroflexi bacterium]|nr:MBL fold metallo-hydrolase [Chloroflexota bacterium]